MGFEKLFFFVIEVDILTETFRNVSEYKQVSLKTFDLTIKNIPLEVTFSIQHSVEPTRATSYDKFDNCVFDEYDNKDAVLNVYLTVYERRRGEVWESF